MKRPPRRLRRLLLLTCATLLLGFCAAGAGVYWVVRSGSPIRSGTLSLPILEQRVEVFFDARAVPHVFAAGSADLARSLGWLHASERMAQMELARRFARGRLAEAVGEAALANDIRMRRLELARTAELGVERLSPESLAWLEAYAQGVNAHLESRARDPLLRLLGVRPEPWTPADSLCIAMLMALELSTSFDGEFARLEVLGLLGPGALDALYAWEEDYLESEHLELAQTVARSSEQVTRPRATRSSRNAAEEPRIVTGTSEITPVGGGSNAWAVSAARSRGTGALLAGDPHLNLGLPSRFYQVRLSAPDYDAQGFSLPGLPMVVIGQGPHRAWSLTTTGADTEDSFVEDFDPRTATVRRGAERVRVEERVEAVRVRGQGGQEVPMWRTEIGPLMPADDARGRPAFSLAWTAHDPGDPLRLFLALARESDPAQVWLAARDYVAPVQTLVVAEAGGEAHYGVIGALPLRGRGAGRLPSPAWDVSFHWGGRSHGAVGPRVEAPTGFVVSANADVRPPGWNDPLPADFAHPSRRNRIAAALDERSSWDLDALAELQGDRLSPYARDLIEALEGPWTGDAHRAADLLAAWDTRVEAGPGALLFQFTVRELVQACGEALLEQPRLARQFFSPLRDALPRLLGPDGELHGKRDQLIAPALERAWGASLRRGGADPARWRLETLQEIELRHPMGDLPWIGARMNRGPYGFGGHDSAIDVAWSRWRGERLEAVGAACLRIVADAADPDRSMAVQPGGQSGHPFDRHYADQIDAWRGGQLHPMHWSRQRAQAAARTTLRLEPGR